MELEIFRVTVKHDAGKCRFIVTSTDGEQSAKHQVMQAELCPKQAIVKVEKIKRRPLKKS